MDKFTLQPPKKTPQEITQAWLDNCALEGIFPDQQTLKEFDLVDTGAMSAEQYLAYLNQKYSAKK